MTITERPEPADMPDWGYPHRSPSDRSPGPMLAAAGGLFVGVAIVLALVVRSPVAVVAWVAAGAAVAAWASARAGGEGARVLPDGVGAGEPGARLARLVSGIAGDLGIAEPEVVTYTDGPVNALVTRRHGRAVLCVAEQLVDSYGLTELESVVTHLLVRVRAGVPHPAWARLVPGWTGRVPPCAPAGFDVIAAAVTRYPPGLASAIRKAEPRDGRDQGLWFVPRASGECTPDGRAEALEDL